MAEVMTSRPHDAAAALSQTDASLKESSQTIEGVLEQLHGFNINPSELTKDVYNLFQSHTSQVSSSGTPVQESAKPDQMPSLSTPPSATRPPTAAATSPTPTPTGAERGPTEPPTDTEQHQQPSAVEQRGGRPSQSSPAGMTTSPCTPEKPGSSSGDGMDAAVAAAEVGEEDSGDSDGNLAVPPTSMRGGMGEGGAASGGGMGTGMGMAVPDAPPPDTPSVTVSVEGIGFQYQLTEEDLGKVFSRYGRVASVHVPPDGTFAVVTYEDFDDARKALNDLNGKLLTGVQGCLRVGWYRGQQLNITPTSSASSQARATGGLSTSPSAHAAAHTGSWTTPANVGVSMGEPSRGSFSSSPAFETQLPASYNTSTHMLPQSPPNNMTPDGRHIRKYTCRFDVGIENDREFQVARRIIGTKGANMKRIFKMSEAKLRLRGKGSGFLEGNTKQESPESLHLCVSCRDYMGYRTAVQMSTELLLSIYEDYRKFCEEKGMPPPNLRIQLREHPLIAKAPRNPRDDHGLMPGGQGPANRGGQWVGLGQQYVGYGGVPPPPIQPPPPPSAGFFGQPNGIMSPSTFGNFGAPPGGIPPHPHHRQHGNLTPLGGRNAWAAEPSYGHQQPGPGQGHMMHHSQQQHHHHTQQSMAMFGGHYLTTAGVGGASGMGGDGSPTVGGGGGAGVMHQGTFFPHAVAGPHASSGRSPVGTASTYTHTPQSQPSPLSVRTMPGWQQAQQTAAASSARVDASHPAASSSTTTMAGQPNHTGDPSGMSFPEWGYFGAFDGSVGASSASGGGAGARAGGAAGGGESGAPHQVGEGGSNAAPSWTPWAPRSPPGAAVSS